MKPDSKRRLSLSKILTLITIILVSGAAACCSIGHKVDSRPVSANPQASFVFVLNTSHIKNCRGNSCSEGVRISSGSGFSIAVDGGHTIALTAGHVCNPDPDVFHTELKARVLGGKEFIAHHLASVPNTDTCILLIEGVEIKPLKVSEREPALGERVFALSAPYGIFDTNMVLKLEGFYSGSTIKRTPPGGLTSLMDLDAYTVPSKPGSSGGPILNSDGGVIGMIVMAHPGFESFSLSPRFASLSGVVDIALLAIAKRR